MHIILIIHQCNMKINLFIDNSTMLKPNMYTQQTIWAYVRGDWEIELTISISG